MPWVARYEGERKGAWQVPFRTDAKCPECGGRVRVWRESSSGTARHFKHIDNIGGETGGESSGACESVAESDKHLKWKNFAAEKLADAFEEQAESCCVEKKLDAPVSGKDRREGDSVLTFQKEDPQMGNGVVVEVQYRNDGKDILETTKDYVAQGYSVVWTSEEDFSDKHCKLSEVDFRERAKEAVWPHYHRFTETDTDWRNGFPNQSEEWLSEIQSSLQNEVPARLPADWYDETARSIWKSVRWSDLFRAPAVDIRALDVGPSEWSLRKEVPFGEWLHERPLAEKIEAEIKQAWYRGRGIRENKLVKECPHCGEVGVHDTLHEGESNRSTTCGSCGEWYTVSSR